ncbi:hypothetical protein PENTCL1PPCAC_22302, partial [Pristionchus entomophagus]
RNSQMSFYNKMQKWLEPKESEEVRQLRVQREAMEIEHQRQMAEMQGRMNALTNTDSKTRQDALNRAQWETQQRAVQEHQRSAALDQSLADERSRSQQQSLADANRSKSERESYASSMERKRLDDERKAEETRRAEKARKDEERKSWEEKQKEADIRSAAEKEEHELKLEEVRREKAARLREIEESAMRYRRENEQRLEEERQRIADAYLKYRNHINMMMSEVAKAMMSRAWNDRVEKQWALKLAGMRDAHSPVHRLFSDIRFSLEDLTRLDGQALGGLVRAEIEIKVQCLLDELNNEIRAMEDEVALMQTYAVDHPEAVYLKDIEESAREIAVSALALQTEIEKVQAHLISQYEEPLSEECRDSCVRCFDELESRVEQIPTVVGLKQKYEHKNRGAYDNFQ